MRVQCAVPVIASILIFGTLGLSATTVFADHFPPSGDDLIVLGNENTPIYISNSDSGRFDFNNDDKTDYFVRAHFTGNYKQLYKVDYKIQDECVDGSNHEDARIKLGFTTLEIDSRERIWLSEGIEAWTPWFKSSRSMDENNLIDLLVLDPGTVPRISFPTDGDDVIEKKSEDKNGSFFHKSSIKELDGQAGWQGAIFFNAPVGEYFMFTIHPFTGNNKCGGLVGLGITIIIEA